MDNDKQPPERIYLADGRWLEDDSRGTWICQVGNPVRHLHEGDPEPLIEEALGRIEAIEARGRAEGAMRVVYDILHSTPDAPGWVRTTMAFIVDAVGEPDTHVSGTQIMDILSRACDGKITLAKARELMQDLIYAHRP